MENITSRFESKIVVDLDQINWEEAGKELEWSVLLKLASGKPFPKKRIVLVLKKV